MQLLFELYQHLCGSLPHKWQKLAKAGSNRQYFRFFNASGESMIGVIGQSQAENHTFIYLSRHFSEKGLPVPKILAVSNDEMRYLQTDLGGYALYDALKDARENGYNYAAHHKAIIERTIRMLPHVQVEGAQGLDFNQCLPPTHFGKVSAMFDFNYFKYCFLRTTEIAHNELRLEEDMQRMAADLAHGEHTTFLYRDFQARNVMIGQEKEPHFIDFQGGNRGPLQYDVASFLWQASAQYPESLREEMIAAYLDELKTLMPVDEDSFRNCLLRFVLFRLLQVLGAYGMRGYFEHKQYFLNSIPPALNNLRAILNRGVAAPYPYLEDVLKRMIDLPQFNTKGNESENPHENRQVLYNSKNTSTTSPLVVTIYSFSFKKGIPTDESGNGGGYVFDCRSTHNPGKYERYKKLTGLDTAVIEFLEKDGEILTFLESVYKLASHHVERYIERQFTHLMFCFGCTGGQHRSVYCAQHLAEYIQRSFHVETRLIHREQGIEQIFKTYEV